MSSGAQEKQVLSREDVLVGQESTSMNEAIELVGGRLVDRGVVEASYVDSMKAREENVSTYLGNGVAMPHGTFEAKEAIKGTGIVVAQFPDGIDWGAGTAHIVIGLAAEGDDHVQVLSQMAEVLQDEELCEQLWTTTDGDLLYDTLSGAGGEDDDDDDAPAEETIVISNPSGLHARPATLIVQLAAASPADLTISKGDKTAKASSIMSVLALGAVSGDSVTLATSGGTAEEERELMKAAAEILTSNDEGH